MNGSVLASVAFMDAVSPQMSPVDFATLDLLPYGIIVLDREGVILYYNRREEEIASRERLEVLGKNFFTEVAPCTRLTEFHDGFRDTIDRDGHTAELKFHFPFPDRPRDVEVALTSFRYDSELLCLVSIRDLTAEEDVREHIRSTERFSEIGEVATGVAHNLNNVLMAIRMWGQVLSRQHPPDSPSGKAVSFILKAVDDGARTVERIREGVREQPVQNELAERVDLSAVASEAVEIARERLGRRSDGTIHIELSLASDLPLISGSSSELQEVIVNLVVNAIDAIAHEGTISVHTSIDRDSVIVEVTDNGSGMSEETKRRLFRPLFTTKGDKGTGLGLSSSYAIARRHGGEVKVRTALGVGSTFSLVLPITSPTM